MRNILLVTLLFIGMNSIAYAEQLQLVQYADAPVHQSVDVNPEGRSIGDLRSRQGTFKATVDGPDVGEYFAQATVVSVNKAEKQTVWSQMIESVYPDGSIYKLDIIVLGDETLAGGGHKHEGAIIGGTGKYAGIRGSYEFEALKGGVYKITNTYWLGQ
jgi:hypothetical protein|tara:strand:+ start:460 stop:933 length:474 start_codon:yes stop_codon:yes gene_type:complete